MKRRGGRGYRVSGGGFVVFQVQYEGDGVAGWVSDVLSLRLFKVRVTASPERRMLRFDPIQLSSCTEMCIPESESGQSLAYDALAMQFTKVAASPATQRNRGQVCFSVLFCERNRGTTETPTSWS